MGTAPPGPRSLVLIGAGPVARIVCEYFRRDSDYDVVAFAVDRDFLETDTLLGLPVIPYDELATHYPPADYSAFAAIGGSQLNNLRERFYNELKAQGYHLASYISSEAAVWPNVQVGEHCMIGEHAVLQPFSKIGNNVFFWTASELGHEAIIKDHVFVSGHVIVGGLSTIGNNCFVGMNSTIIEELDIGPDSIIGAGSTVTRNTRRGTVSAGPRVSTKDFTSYEYFDIPAPST